MGKRACLYLALCLLEMDVFGVATSAVKKLISVIHIIIKKKLMSGAYPTG